MDELKVNLVPVAEDIVKQLKNVVPVRTGRLKNSIRYSITKQGNDYIISIVAEDYIAWLKPKTKPSTLPTPRELALATPPLPKMNDLKLRGIEQLSPRAQGLFQKIDVEGAFDKIDLTPFEDEIRKILAYDKL